MKEKKLLIVERCNSNLQHIEEGNDSIVLTGVFTTFNVKNRNGRVYESADFLPHVENLKSVIEAGSLLGELDHPHSFETTLANASHVVEGLEYDPQQNAIIGRIRLLNTSKGKDAQALVKDGIPLHISSRAAGTVDESGRVRLQQLFTYDLVAEPGFANAVLTRVNEGVDNNPISNESRMALQAINESYDFLNENCKKVVSEDGFEVYELSEDVNTNLVPEVGEEGAKAVDFAPEQAEKNADAAPIEMVVNGSDENNNDNNMEDNGQFIKYDDFQKYSEHLSEIISELQSAMSNFKNELANMASKSEATPTEQYAADKIDNSMISDLVAKEVENKVAEISVPGDVAPAEEVADLKAKAAEMEEKYSNLLKYTNYLAEMVDMSIVHQDYLAENMNKMIEHQDYLAENINDTIAYQNYVAEMVDKTIDYSQMIAEEANKSIAYQDYLAEKMNQMVNHADYIAEEVNKMSENLVEEAKVEEAVVEETPVEAVVEEAVVEEVNAEDVVVEETPAEAVVEEAKVEEAVVEDTPAFDYNSYRNALSEKLATLISTVETQYAEAKAAEAKAIEESKAKVQSQDFTLINCIPSRLMERWTALSDDRKKEILAESKLFVINNAATAEYFWNTRDLRESKVETPVEESAVATPAQPLNENVMSDDRMKMMAESIKYRMRRF